MATLNPRDVVIVDGVRTAMGKSKNGMFRNVRADSMSAELVRALVARNQFDVNEVEDVTLIGCNLCSSRVDCLHRRTTQTVNRLTASSLWNISQ